MTEQLLREKASALNQLIKQKQEKEKEVEGIADEIEALKADITAQMEGLDIQNAKIEGVGTLYLSSLFFVSLNKENPEAKSKIVEWLDQNGLGALAPRTVNTRTLGGLYKERLEKNETVPGSDIVSVRTGKEARLRPA